MDEGENTLCLPEIRQMLPRGSPRDGRRDTSRDCLEELVAFIIGGVVLCNVAAFDEVVVVGAEGYARCAFCA